MQKKLIAIAVAAALAPAAAMADTTVYGRIHMSLDNVTGSTGVGAQDQKLAINSNSSRFGVKGSEDLGDGLKALYQIEAGVSANGTAGVPFSNVRDTYIGLTGGFGTFLAGRLPAANQFVYDSNLFADQLGDAANFTGKALGGVGRANSALHYVSPSMSGFNAALTFIPGQSVGQNLNGAKVRGSNGSATTVTVGNVATSHGKNSYGMKLNYAGAGVTASLTYFDVAAQINATSSATLKPLSIAGSYDFGNGMVTAQYVKADTTVGATRFDATKYYNIGGKFNVSGNSAIKAQYSHASDDGTASATNGAKMFAIGYDYNFSKRTGMYVVYAATSNDATGMFTMSGWGNQGQVNGVTTAGDDPHGLGIGLTHSF